MVEKPYSPQPLATDDVTLPAGLTRLTELMARNAHDVWAKARLEQGWSYGPERDDRLLKHPCLVPYEELPENEKAYDRLMALETLKLIVKLGFDLVPKNGGTKGL